MLGFVSQQTQASRCPDVTDSPVPDTPDTADPTGRVYRGADARTVLGSDSAPGAG